DLLFRLLAESFQLAEAMGLRGFSQRLDVRDPQLLPQLLDLLRADPADPQHVEHARREAGFQLLVISDLARCHVLLDLLPQRLPDARDRGHTTLSDEVLDVFREGLQLTRRARYEMMRNASSPRMS